MSEELRRIWRGDYAGLCGGVAFASRLAMMKSLSASWLSQLGVLVEHETTLMMIACASSAISAICRSF